MAQFKAIIKGNRGKASRLGTKKSGIETRVDGRSLGVAVRGESYQDKEG